MVTPKCGVELPSFTLLGPTEHHSALQRTLVRCNGLKARLDSSTSEFEGPS